jgi:glycosyltransferase involved in cell wall biosynthesis
MSRRAARIGRRGHRYDFVFYMPWIGPLLADGAPLPTGGAETQVFLVASALAERGARVCLVAYDQDGRLPKRVGKVDILSRPAYGGDKRAIGKIVEAFSIWRALTRVDAEVIVTRSFGPHVGIVGVLAWIRRRHFVYSSAHVVDFTFELETKRRNLALYRLGVRLADSIVVQTEEQIELCRTAFNREPVLIRSYAEPAEPSDAEREAFLWVARAVWYKRPELFLELARRVPEARFRMVAVPGEGFGDALLEELRNAAAKIPNLELLDPRPRRELLELMRHAVAIVNTADFEGMPNIFLEGWARGVPAMSLSHDPDGVLVREGIGFHAGGSIERMAEEARELWRTREDIGPMGDRCRRYVEANHSPDVVAAKWLEMLEPRNRAAARPASSSSAPTLMRAPGHVQREFDPNEVS